MSLFANDPKAWLAALKTGDAVATKRSGVGFTPEIHRVARVTATQILLDNNKRFRRDSGYQIGLKSSWHSVYLVDATREVRDAIELQQLRDWATASTSWRSTPLHVLRAVKQAHDSASQQQAA